MAMAQLLALLLSLGLSFEVSACPPGMDTGMEMPMPAAGEHHVRDGMDCPFGGAMDEDGRANCPLAVGGIGTCGTNAPTPGHFVEAALPEAFAAPPLVSATVARLDYSADVQLPPPRS